MKILLLAIAAILVQIPSISPETQARIEGTVTGPNGPMAGAAVIAMWDPAPTLIQPEMVPRATTSADGKFVIQLAPGVYRLSARAPGYVPQSGNVIRLNPQESLKDLTFTLTAEGVLSGRVATTDGRPLVRIEVLALKKTFTATGPSLESQGRAQTNDRGEYRIAGLTAGAYVVAARELSPVMIAFEASVARRDNIAAPVAPSPGAFGPLYYPDAVQSSRASAVKILSGIETRNIDFLLPKRRVYAIRGRVIGAPTIQVQGQPRSTATTRITPANAEYFNGSANVPLNADGTFEFTGVAPGVHWVIAQVPATLTAEQRVLLSTPGADLAQAQLPRPLRGIALVQVGDSDVDNVELTMVQDLEVSGHLSVDGEQVDFSGRSADFRLELRPTEPAGNGPSSNFSSLDADGELTYRRLLPAEYRLTISALPAPYYVKEARYGNIDALAEAIRLTKPSPDRINIVLARGTEVRGTLADAAPGHKVILIPDGTPQRHDLYKTATTNAAGGFTFNGVAPGNYKAFAWQTLEDFQYFDEAFVARFRDSGTAVRVIGTSDVEIQVGLIH